MKPSEHLQNPLAEWAAGARRCLEQAAASWQRTWEGATRTLLHQPDAAVESSSRQQHDTGRRVVRMPRFAPFASISEASLGGGSAKPAPRGAMAAADAGGQAGKAPPEEEERILISEASRRQYVNNNASTPFAACCDVQLNVLSKSAALPSVSAYVAALSPSSELTRFLCGSMPANSILSYSVGVHSTAAAHDTFERTRAPLSHHPPRCYSLLISAASSPLQIEVVGVDGQLRAVAEAALTTRPNFAYTLKEVEADLQRVFDTGWFARCVPEAEDTRDGVKLLIRVRRAAAHSKWLLHQLLCGVAWCCSVDRAGTGRHVPEAGMHDARLARMLEMPAFVLCDLPPTGAAQPLIHGFHRPHRLACMLTPFFALQRAAGSAQP